MRVWSQCQVLLIVCLWKSKGALVEIMREADVWNPVWIPNCSIIRYSSPGVSRVEYFFGLGFLGRVFFRVEFLGPCIFSGRDFWVEFFGSYIFSGLVYSGRVFSRFLFLETSFFSVLACSGLVLESLLDRVELVRPCFTGRVISGLCFLLVLLIRFTPLCFFGAHVRIYFDQSLYGNRPTDCTQLVSHHPSTFR